MKWKLRFVPGVRALGFSKPGGAPGDGDPRCIQGFQDKGGAPHLVFYRDSMEKLSCESLSPV